MNIQCSLTTADIAHQSLKQGWKPGSLAAGISLLFGTMLLTVLPGWKDMFRIKRLSGLQWTMLVLLHGHHQAGQHSSNICWCAGGVEHGSTNDDICAWLSNLQC